MHRTRSFLNLISRSVILCLSIGLLLGLQSSAAAHGRFPATGSVVFHPTDEDKIAVRTTFGVLLSRDAGISWQWICREVVNLSLTNDPEVYWFDTGLLAMASFDGLQVSPDGGCSWDFANDELSSIIMYDLEADPSNPARALAMSSSGNLPNRLYETTDHGATWTATPAPIAEPGFITESMAIAPSQTNRIFVSGSHLASAEAPRRPTVYRTDDGGSTWSEFPVTLPEGNRTLFAMAVSPIDPDIVFLRTNAETATDNPERLLRSADGGETWTEVLSDNLITGAAFTEDGTTLWIGTQGDNSLYRSDDSGITFVPVETPFTVGCVAVRADTLWLCTENFLDGAGLHVSDDEGASFRPLLDFQRDITGVLECEADAETTRACEAPLDDLVRDLGLADTGMFPDGGAMQIPVDPLPPTDASSGCGCVVIGSQPSSNAAAILCLFGLILIRRRMR